MVLLDLATLGPGSTGVGNDDGGGGTNRMPGSTEDTGSGGAVAGAVAAVLLLALGGGMLYWRHRRRGAVRKDFDMVFVPFLPALPAPALLHPRAPARVSVPCCAAARWSASCQLIGAGLAVLVFMLGP